MRGRRLRSTGGADLRPTSGRIRAAIFSIIGQKAVEETRVLDLYAGTGALGIEALSRGALWADFVEVHPGRCRHLRENLRQIGLAEQGRVYQAGVEKALQVLGGGYDLVLADPPYDMEPWDLLMQKLESRQMLNDGALVILEHRHGHQLAERYGKLVRIASRRYGDTSISMYRVGCSHG